MPSAWPAHFLLKKHLAPARQGILSKQSPGPISKYENMLCAASMEITGATWHFLSYRIVVHNVITEFISNDNLLN